ncbi:hypothetical protein HWQ46_24270 [Shewanella sp. D64]|uniref:hypothetical protein n=1 Tax=unclassified Shewanella TaxID=196818 RepID=UPI0022BA1B4F|nr:MULTISPECIES: hypothetical protein [unclassified Shewanella]MEC4728642.1 hypothetical protein [Shewanella sp. D64]MEC4740595.1 hypothetical protein [Shewanella sp. E94]WBJ98299.1 hypothetical protein HWQ47_25350 [Shewanella sp. MTB7]
MAFSISYRMTFVSVLISIGVLFSNSLQAKDGLSLSEKAEAADKLSKTLEQEQLQKARDAAGETLARERKILKKQQNGDWESEQREKAQKQFNERESREDKYLRQAKEAAAKERKIPKP